MKNFKYQKGTLKKALSMIFLLLIIGFAAYYIISNISDFRKLSIVNPAYIIYLVAINLIFAMTNGIVIKEILSPFRIKLIFKEWFGLSVITTFYNTFTPFRGGAIARAAYLKRKHDFSYSNFIATISGVYVINFLAASVLGLISLLFIYIYYGIFNAAVLMIFAAFFIPSLLIVLFSPRFAERKNRYLNNIINIINGWHSIRKDRRTVSVVTIVIASQLIISVLGTFLAYAVFGLDIGMIKSLYIVSISYIGTVISITPGALGIAEAVQVFSALVVGIAPEYSISASLLGRAISIPILAVLGPVFSYILLNKAIYKR